MATQEVADGFLGVFLALSRLAKQGPCDSARFINAYAFHQLFHTSELASLEISQINKPSRGKPRQTIKEIQTEAAICLLANIRGTMGPTVELAKDLKGLHSAKHCMLSHCLRGSWRTFGRKSCSSSKRLSL